MPSELDDLREYMRACIRAQAPRNIEHWDDTTLRNAFLTIPTSHRDFDDWRAKSNRTPALVAAANAATPSEPPPAAEQIFATPEQAARNEAAIAALANDFPDLKDRLADEAAAAKAAQTPQS